MTHFLFWDIDGTLLWTARAGVFALEDAARELIGRPIDLREMPTAGLTDAQIARAVVEAHGAPAGEADVDAFLRVYERRLPERLPLRKGRVMPNVRDILESLAGRDDVVSLLLTGNTPVGARAKLTHYGLIDYFPGAGAFCVDGGERASIARRALELAAAHRGGEHPEADRTTVIGDTPHDIECGKAIGTRTLAVATGGYELAALTACGPDWALAQLPRPDAFSERLGLDRGRQHY